MSVDSFVDSLYKTTTLYSMSLLISERSKVKGESHVIDIVPFEEHVRFNIRFMPVTSERLPKIQRQVINRE